MIKKVRCSPLRLLTAIALGALLSSTSPAFAEGEEVPVEPPIEVVTEAPLPTEAPPPPPTPEPTLEPTLAPEPTLEPTLAPAPTEAPAPTTEVPVSTESPVVPTEVPGATPSPSPTEEPTPTAVPLGVLSYDLAATPDCELDSNQPASIASGGTITYLCTDTLALSGSTVVPSEIDVAWTIQADVPGGWTVRLLPPVNTPEEVVDWTPAGLADTWFTFDQRDAAGTGTEPLDISVNPTITFRVEVQRASCSMTSQQIRLRHEVSVASPGIDVSATPKPEAEPLRLQPALAPVADPTVTFNGGLDLGQVGVTAAGASESVRSGTLSLQVSGLDAACGTWQLSTQTTPLVSESGQPLAGSQLVAVAVNGNAIDDCDLASGCALQSYVGGPTEQNSVSLVLTVELRLPEQTSIGAFQTTIDAALLLTASSSPLVTQPDLPDPVDP